MDIAYQSITCDMMIRYATAAMNKLQNSITVPMTRGLSFTLAIVSAMRLARPIHSGNAEHVTS